MKEMNITLAQEYKVVVVATFDIIGNAVTQEEADAITELFITELVSTGKVSVLGRMEFDKIIKDMNFQASDLSDSSKTAMLGEALNAQLISRGKIIKLGNKLYLFSSIIDAKNAKVVSSVREEFDSLDDIFGRLGNFVMNLVVGLSLKIGDKGPGGGIVFHIEGNKSYEVSDLLGRATWGKAFELCYDYRGGGYDDWYLPTEDELNLIYNNLKNIDEISMKCWHWSSTHFVGGPAFRMWFGSGHGVFDNKHRKCCVRAVRAF